MKWNCIFLKLKSSWSLKRNAANRTNLGLTEKFGICKIKFKSTKRRWWIYKTSSTKCVLEMIRDPLPNPRRARCQLNQKAKNEKNSLMLLVRRPLRQVTGSSNWKVNLRKPGSELKKKKKPANRRKNTPGKRKRKRRTPKLNCKLSKINWKKSKRQEREIKI